MVAVVKRPGGNPSPSFLFAPRKPARTISPVTLELMSRMDASGRSARTIGHAAGVHAVTISGWRHGRYSPRLIDFENVAQAMGYRLVLEPIDKEGS